MRPFSRSRRRLPPVRLVAAHAARLAVVAAIAWLAHAGQARFDARRSAVDLARVPLERIQRHLPAAAAVGGPAAAVDGGREILDAAGGVVGAVLHTSPAGDAAIGFSGPTDLLVVCDGGLQVAGIEILASRDTRDHVHAVERDAAFWRSFQGRPLAALATAAPDRAAAVAGSTLTSLAIAEALALRLGGRATASRFAAAPGRADLQLLFPDAATIAADPGDPAVIRVAAADGAPLGWALRTSPAADRVIGYQGPTDAVVGFDAAGQVCGVAVLASFDNEPYVGYVRDDAAFRGVYRGMTFEEVAGIDPAATGIEGVSGATMTSQAVAEGIVRAARARHAGATASSPVAAALAAIDGPQWGAIALVAVGVVTGFTRLRGTWFGRLALPVAVIAYLGFGAGALVSQAQLAGWVRAGVPRGAAVLAALTAAAVIVPAIGGRNVYCSHLCAHGAAQQLLLRFVRPKRPLPRWLGPLPIVLPWALLAVAILATVLRWPIALVDLEPFDAYLPAIAGLVALVLFAVSLAASACVPMAYCRHGCPTGALLDHLRFHGHADRPTWRDAILLGCLAVAAAMHWWPT